MTLDEYQKILEEKRKALNATKTEERKVDLDKDLESMQQLSIKKGNDDIYKVGKGANRDLGKRKETAVKKSVSINEFLKPADGEDSIAQQVAAVAWGAVIMDHSGVLPVAARAHQPQHPLLKTQESSRH